MALNDEGQQHGNLDESSAIARVPRKGLVVWCGDHKQTPGGLRKSEARAFRRKLMRRSIALRGDTKFIPPHMLGAKLSFRMCKMCLGPKLQVCVSCSKKALGNPLSCPLRVYLSYRSCVKKPSAGAGMLWPLRAAVRSLILPSSARVSELTYVTIVGTRYPELDTIQNDIIQFGNHLQGEQSTRGGFLPIFWDAPYSYIHASTDIGEVVDWIRASSR